ncbi:hypothetical protein ACS0TY_018902 [Phlomoides rotata]
MANHKFRVYEIPPTSNQNKKSDHGLPFVRNKKSTDVRATKRAIHKRLGVFSIVTGATQRSNNGKVINESYHSGFGRCFAMLWMNQNKLARNMRRKRFSLVDKIATQITSMRNLVEVSDDDC